MYGVNGHEIMTEVAKLLDAIRCAQQKERTVKAEFPDAATPNVGFFARFRRRISPTRPINLANVPDNHCQALNGVAQR